MERSLTDQSHADLTAKEKTISDLNAQLDKALQESQKTQAASLAK